MKSKTNDKKSSLESRLATDKTLIAVVRMLAVTGCEPGELPFDVKKNKTEEIATEAIDQLKNPALLSELINHDPFIKNPSVMLSIYILRCIAGIDDYQLAIWGRDYLKKLGLTGFVPPRGKNRTTNNVFYVIREEPGLFRQLVETWKTALLKLFEDCPNNHKHSVNASFALTPHGGSIINTCCIQHSFKSVYGEETPEDFFDFNIPRNIDITVLTLRFLSYRYHVPFPSLYKNFYQPR